MSRGVNKVILVGNLGADPETRYTANGGAITTIRIATSEQWTDKTSGQKQERTEWHRIKFFGRLAEIAGEYLKKGRQVYVEGSLRTDKYTDKEGVERGESGGRGDMPSRAERGPRGAQGAQGGAAAAPAAAGKTEAFEDDDIPF